MESILVYLSFSPVDGLKDFLKITEDKGIHTLSTLSGESCKDQFGHGDFLILLRKEKTIQDKWWNELVRRSEKRYESRKNKGGAE